jgi:hypothetical protein
MQLLLTAIVSTNTCSHYAELHTIHFYHKIRIGTLATVSGPDYFVNKVKDYLSKQGYPDENILTV